MLLLNMVHTDIIHSMVDFVPAVKESPNANIRNTLLFFGLDVRILVDDDIAASTLIVLIRNLPLLPRIANIQRSDTVNSIINNAGIR